MRINKIEKNIFNPSSIAVIGATAKPGSVGLAIVKNLLNSPSKRKIFLVNPNHKTILGRKSYSSILDITSKIDLAVIVVPNKIVPQIVNQCLQKRAEGVIIISAGFAEIGEEGRKRQEEIAKKLKEADIPLVGPNCLGIISLPNNLNASFAPSTLRKGKIAFVSQSGAVIDAIIDKSLEENYGFSRIISCGNEAGLTLSDFLEYLAKDNETKVITIYTEEIKQGRKFVRLAHKISSQKPIIILKAGKSKAGQKAVQSHTGSLAGQAEIYSAAFWQSGVIEEESLEGMFDLAKALSWQPRVKGEIAVVTNGGGCGVLAADYSQELGLKLSSLYPETLKMIDKSGLMNPNYSRRNPLDIVGDALPSRYKIALDSLLSQKNINGLIVIQTPQLMTDSLEDARIVVEAHKKFPLKPIVGCFLGGKIAQPGIDFLEENHIPNYPDVLRAVKAMRGLILKP